MLYIFDKDDTLIHSLPGRPANTPEEQVVMEGVKEKIQELKADGHDLAIASNQGGVAFGHMTSAELVAVMRDASEKTGIESWSVCPHHPEGTIERMAYNCRRRKPSPGMLIDIMDWFKASASDTLFVGDSDTDRQAAQNAGVAFEWADEFFKR